MKGFSLHQPWAWALVHRDKVENRPMRPPANMIGQRFAVQAAKTWDDDAIPFMQKRGIDVPLMDPHAEPQANMARVTEFSRMVVLGAIIGVATLDRYVGTEAEVAALTPEQSRWFVGRYGYICRDRIPLNEPVPCRGMQGFFPLPPDVEKAVMKQLEPPRVYDSTLPPAVAAASNAMKRRLPMVVIYDRPHDAPSGFVVRMWAVRNDGTIVPGKLLGKDLVSIDAARASVPPGMVNIGRTDTDDAKIVEVWV